MITDDFAIQIVLSLAAAGGVYAGIRADLREAMLNASDAKKSANEAHGRLDSHIEKHHIK